MNERSLLLDLEDASSGQTRDVVGARFLCGQTRCGLVFALRLEELVVVLERPTERVAKMRRLADADAPRR